MKKLSLLLLILLLCTLAVGMGISTGAQTSSTNVAKVGNTEYATIDEAVDAWTSQPSTLTLLSDVTLSNVIKLKSTEHHILNLGVYTMTAAANNHAIEITCNGQGSATPALTVNADAENPGGITATGKSCIYYRKSGTTKDRLIIQINGGVFNGSYAVNVYSSNRGTNCPQVNIAGGTFNGNISINAGKLMASGGLFNGWINCVGDSTAYRQISGGTYAQWQFMTSDSSSKFWVGTSKENYNVGVYVDDNGYLVVGGSVITEPGEKFAASSANYGGWNSSLKYSSAKTNGLYYTSATEAFADNNKASGVVTVHASTLDMTGVTYPGTILINNELTMTFAGDTTPTWKVDTQLKDKVAVYTDTVNVETGVVTRKYSLVTVTVITDSANPEDTAVGGTVAAGGSQELIATPKPGYYFKCWNNDEQNTNSTLSFDPATCNELTATFALKTPEKTPNASFIHPDQLFGLVPNGVYTITVDSTSSDYTADARGILTVQKAWYGKSISIVTKATAVQYLDSEAQTLEIPACYFITLNYGDGIASEEIKLFDSLLTYPAPKAIGGKIFMGWYSDEALTTPYDFNATVTENITLYAKYTDYREDLKGIDDAVDNLRNAASLLQTAVDTKADSAVIEAALANLAASVAALEQAKEDYIVADAKLKAELEDAIEKAKQEVLEATKPSLPYVGENGNWWIGDTDTGLSTTPTITTDEANAPVPDNNEATTEEDHNSSKLSTAVAGTAIAGNSVIMAAWTVLKKKRRF